MQTELIHPGPLLDSDGRPAQVGWSRQPLLDANLENARFYALRPLQRFRMKRWDYYALFTPRGFFSATVADLGYAANVFVYTLDYANGELYEEGLVVPLARGVRLARSSATGETAYESDKAALRFTTGPDGRRVYVDWPGFHGGRGIAADVHLATSR